MCSIRYELFRVIRLAKQERDENKTSGSSLKRKMS